MRNWLATLALLPLALAGCSDDSNESGDADVPDSGGAAAAAGTLHADDFTATGMIVAGVTGTPVVGAFPSCGAPTSECHGHPFTVTIDGALTNATRKLPMAAALTWTNPASDVDLYLLDDGGSVVASSLAGAPGTSEQVAADLKAGDYTLLVEGYHAAGESYTLAVTFG